MSCADAASAVSSLRINNINNNSNMGCTYGFLVLGGIILILWDLLCWLFSSLWWLICNVLPAILAFFLFVGFYQWGVKYRKTKKKHWGVLTSLLVISSLLFLWMNAAWDWHVFGDDDNNQDQELYEPQVESRPSTSNKKKPRRSSSSVHSVPSHSSGSHYNSDYEDGYEAGYEDGYHEDSYDRHKGSSSSYNDGYKQGYYDGAYEGGGGDFWDD